MDFPKYSNMRLDFLRSSTFMTGPSILWGRMLSLMRFSLNIGTTYLRVRDLFLPLSLKAASFAVLRMELSIVLYDLKRSCLEFPN